MKPIIPVLICLALCSCKTIGEMQAEHAEKLQAQENAQDDARCKSFGIAFGTNDYINCREFLIAQRNNQAAVQAQVGAQQQQNLLNYSGALMQMGQPYSAAATPQTTTCTRQGVFTNCVGQ